MRMRSSCFALTVWIVGWISLSATHAALPIGSTAPGFMLPGVDGAFHSLDTLKGEKATVIVFTCNHCPVSKAYEDRLIALQRRYEGKGVELVAINPNNAETHKQDGFEKMKKRAADKGFPFPYLRDRTQLVAATYGADVTPHIFLFDSGLTLRYEGRIDDNWHRPGAVESHDLANAIDALLADRDVDRANTNPRGCSIKWILPGKTPPTSYRIAPSPDAIAPLKVGDTLPNALVADMDGNAVWLMDEVLGTKTVLVVFRGGWCMYCTRQLAGLQGVADEMKQRGYRIVAISPDTPEGTVKGTDALDLGYSLLADLGMEAIIAMGLAFELDEATLKAYREYKIPLRSPPTGSGRVLPVPAVYLLDKSGRITYVYTNADYKVRLDPDSLLKAAK